jgi:two-component system, OmpR family, response regulator ChvI
MPTIALVEEDPKALDDMSSRLEAEGYRIQAYQDAASALDGLETDSPDLLILDVSFADLDGQELVRQLREKLNIPLIIMTARAVAPDEFANMQMPADELIRKPFSERVLVNRVRTLLRRQGFAEDAGNKTVSTEAGEREPAAASATRHLTPSEQRVFSAALRRSVKVISSGASR